MVTRVWKAYLHREDSRSPKEENRDRPRNNEVKNVSSATNTYIDKCRFTVDWLRQRTLPLWWFSAIIGFGDVYANFDGYTAIDAIVSSGQTSGPTGARHDDSCTAFAAFAEGMAFTTFAVGTVFAGSAKWNSCVPSAASVKGNT
ncbi:uncharacterized protein IUM83_08394 [Phytophthora cinnamomi]|uniref:uncharacterized protein n=1 Tax=Phytophthora cinnamomi TaxID=4785 RepID=UPI003559C2F0|nr:hypothetical protein IUM83_08394 [Phytophthora cinnamomi]